MTFLELLSNVNKECRFVLKRTKNNSSTIVDAVGDFKLDDTNCMIFSGYEDIMFTTIKYKERCSGKIMVKKLNEDIDFSSLSLKNRKLISKYLKHQNYRKILKIISTTENWLFCEFSKDLNPYIIHKIVDKKYGLGKHYMCSTHKERLLQKYNTCNLKIKILEDKRKDIDDEICKLKISLSNLRIKISNI